MPRKTAFRNVAIVLTESNVVGRSDAEANPGRAASTDKNRLQIPGPFSMVDLGAHRGTIFSNTCSEPV